MWQRAYGGIAPSPTGFGGPQVRQTPDGAFIVSSVTNVSASKYFPWIFKVDSNGSIIWQEVFPGLGPPTVTPSIDTTLDGGLLIVSNTPGTGLCQRGPPLVCPEGSTFVLRLNSTGYIDWQKAYTGQGTASALSIYHTSDGGAIVAGGTDPVGTRTPNAWLLKLDTNSGVSWQKAYIGASNLISVQETADGSFISTGVGSPLGSIQVLRVDGKGIPI